jgi:hypothetical protein
MFRPCIMCIYLHIHAVKTQQLYMVSLCNLHYSTIYDMFRPCKWAIIRLLVEPMGGLYTKGLGGGDEISSYIILWDSGLLILYMLSGYRVDSQITCVILTTHYPIR